MDRQALERLDDTGIGAWDSHRPEDFVDLLADDFVLRDTTLAEPITTKDGALQYVQAWLTAFPDMRIHRTSRLIDDDAVAGEIEFTGTNAGPMAMGGAHLPPTGKTVVGRGAYFVRVRDDKIVEFRAHPDAAGIMAQLGMMP